MTVSVKQLSQNHLEFTEIVYTYTVLKIEGNLRWRNFRNMMDDYFEGGNRAPSLLTLKLFGII